MNNNVRSFKNITVGEVNGIKSPPINFMYVVNVFGNKSDRKSCRFL